MKLTINIFTFLLFVYSLSFAQTEQYNYKRELKGISEQWHKIILPDEIFGKTSQNLSDIRIFGIKENFDTIEAPYLLQLMAEKKSNKKVRFKLLNISHKQEGYYFTFEIPKREPINQIKLDFLQQNFDWRIALEGSQDQYEWFTILKDYRILSIKNDLTDFQFTKLTFSGSQYQFFRIHFMSEEKPELIAANIAQQEITEGIIRNYPIKKLSTKENKQNKQTEIDIELKLAVPISQIKLRVTDTFDYYRPITIKFLRDSFKTEQAWEYHYSTLTSGILNSIEENKFKFNKRTTQKLKILIHNHDNQALNIGTIEVKGYIHNLVARFTEPASYYLSYGNNSKTNPQYDINRFTNNIPKKLKSLELGKEILIKMEQTPLKNPIFNNKTWLWLIMSSIILILGWITLNMLRKK